MTFSKIGEKLIEASQTAASLTWDAATGPLTLSGHALATSIKGSGQALSAFATGTFTNLVNLRYSPDDTTSSKIMKKEFNAKQLLTDHLPNISGIAGAQFMLAHLLAPSLTLIANLGCIFFSFIQNKPLNIEEDAVTNKMSIFKQIACGAFKHTVQFLIAYAAIAKGLPLIGLSNPIISSLLLLVAMLACKYLLSTDETQQ